MFIMDVKFWDGPRPSINNKGLIMIVLDPNNTKPFIPIWFGVIQIGSQIVTGIFFYTCAACFALCN